MAEAYRPYRRSGIQPVSIPIVPSQSLRQSAQNSQNLANALIRMGDVLSDKLARRRVREGEESVLRDPVTLNDLQNGTSNNLDQFNEDTNFGLAAKAKAFELLGMEVKNKVTQTNATLIANAYENNTDPDELKEQLQSTAFGAVKPLQDAGYRGFSNALLADLGVKKSAKLLSYQKDYIKRRQKEDKAKAVTSIIETQEEFPSVIDAVITSNPGITPNEIDAAVLGHARKVANMGLIAGYNAKEIEELYKKTLTSSKKSIVSSLTNLVSASENGVSTIIKLGKGKQVNDYRVMAMYGSLSNEEKINFRAEARRIINQRFDLDAKLEAEHEKTFINKGKNLEIEYSKAIAAEDFNKAISIGNAFLSGGHDADKGQKMITNAEELIDPVVESDSNVLGYIKTLNNKGQLTHSILNNYLTRLTPDDYRDELDRLNAVNDKRISKQMRIYGGNLGYDPMTADATNVKKETQKAQYNALRAHLTEMFVQAENGEIESFNVSEAAQQWKDTVGETIKKSKDAAFARQVEKDINDIKRLFEFNEKIQADNIKEMIQVLNSMNELKIAISGDRNVDLNEIATKVPTIIDRLVKFRDLPND